MKPDKTDHWVCKMWQMSFAYLDTLYQTVLFYLLVEILPQLRYIIHIPCLHPTTTRNKMSLITLPCSILPPKKRKKKFETFPLSFHQSICESTLCISFLFINYQTHNSSQVDIKLYHLNNNVDNDIIYEVMMWHQWKCNISVICTCCWSPCVD